jgi:hypothetical protein
LSSLFLFLKKIFILPQEFYKTVEDENQKIKYSGGTGLPVPLATAKNCLRWIVLGKKNSLARGVVQSAKICRPVFGRINHSNRFYQPENKKWCWQTSTTSYR